MAQRGTPRFVALTCAGAVLAGVLKLGRVPGTLDLAATQRESSAITLPSLDVFRPEEGLIFANATSLRDEVLKRVPDAKVPVREVLLDLELTDDLDVPGADMLAGLHEDLSNRGITLSLARVHAPTLRLLERTGVLAMVGRENVHPHVRGGVDVLYLVRSRVDEAGAAARRGAAQTGGPAHPAG
ncbi:sodium-independent anion transporter [Corallococcus sp. AB011P]|nr:sodium-independent anion transporter [Corallococcus sp. AB011P]